MTFLKLCRAGFHTVLLFVLPWFIGAITGMVFNIDEVEEQGGGFFRWFGLLTFPLLAVQVVGITVKVLRAMSAARKLGNGRIVSFVESLDEHVRVLTTRGLWVAFSAMLMVFIALWIKWAQLGTIAIATLGTLYLFSTLATFTSAFSVRNFDDRLRRRRGSIEREMSPTVVDAGDPVEERFTLSRVPVPPIFRLHIEEELPRGLAGETRFAADRHVSREVATLSAPLPRTARGVYRLGPAKIWYEDILGLTRVAVAAQATASLRVLPRLRPVILDKRPKSLTKADGPLALLARLPTEEYFRTRPYVHGDDLRRVHWKLSVNTGALHVRQPETVPFSPQRVCLVLDTYVPPRLLRASEHLADALDLLIEGWVGLAHTLQKRGEKVSLLAAIRTDGELKVKFMECKRGEERVWRSMGADAAWQAEAPLHWVMPQAMAHRGQCIVFSALLYPPPQMPSEGDSSIISCDVRGLVADLEGDTRGWLKKALLHRYPVGADDNGASLAQLMKPKIPAALVKRDLDAALQFSGGYVPYAGARILRLSRRGPHLALGGWT